MSDPVIVWNERGYNFAFHDWDGPVGKDLARRARRLERSAEKSANVRTGALKLSIDTNLGHEAGELAAKVGANPAGHKVGYALFHHEGTRRHSIVARRAVALRFRSKGRVVYAKSVKHPGTRANPFLVRHLREVLS